MRKVNLTGSKTAIGEKFELHQRGLTLLNTTRRFGLPFQDLGETLLEAQWIIMEGIMPTIDHVDFGLLGFGCRTLDLFLSCLEQVLAMLVANQLVPSGVDQMEFRRDQKLWGQMLDLGELIS